MGPMAKNVLLFGAGCATTALAAGAWSLLGAAPPPATAPVVQCAPVVAAQDDAERVGLRARLEVLTAQLAVLTANREAQGPPARALAEQLAPAPSPPLAVVGAPVAAPERVAAPSGSPPGELPAAAVATNVPAPAPAPPPAVAPPVVPPEVAQDLTALRDQSEARAEKRGAVRAAVESLAPLDAQLSHGDTAGVTAALEQAAASLDGAAALELRAAAQSLENKDVPTARQHLELALLRSRER